jgi:hypothetical protein
MTIPATAAAPPAAPAAGSGGCERAGKTEDAIKTATQQERTSLSNLCMVIVSGGGPFRFPPELASPRTDNPNKICAYRIE